jgi:large subunit ribosomal protein L16
MGKGKGNLEFWAAVVQPGRIIFEVDGVSEEVARRALALASGKLPIKTKFTMRRDLVTN